MNMGPELLQKDVAFIASFFVIFPLSNKSFINLLPTGYPVIMLIKNAYELMLGHLYTLFIMGEKMLQMPSITPVDANSFVKIKKGSKDGNKIFAQTSIPLVATAEYLEGFMAIKMINKRIKIPNTK